MICQNTATQSSEEMTNLEKIIDDEAMLTCEIAETSSK